MTSAKHLLKPHILSPLSSPIYTICLSLISKNIPVTIGQTMVIVVFVQSFFIAYQVCHAVFFCRMSTTMCIVPYKTEIGFRYRKTTHSQNHEYLY